MLRTATTALAAALAAACAASLAPAPADAAPVYRSAFFELQLRGTQVSTWEYHTDTLKDDRCGSKVDAYGDQTLRFKTNRPRSTHGSFSIGSNGRTTIATLTSKVRSLPWQIAAEAERNGTRVVDLGTNRGDCGDNGGGVEPRQREDKSCGKRHGWLEPDLVSVRRGRGLRLTGESDEWGTTLLTEGGTDLDATYEDCPFWEGGPYTPEKDGGILPAVEKLPLEKLLDKRRKKIVFDFGSTKSYREGPFTGKTITTGKATLTRVAAPRLNG